MERMRKEYLVLKSDQAGDADIVGVFSSKRKARTAVETDSTEQEPGSSYWVVVLLEDRLIRSLVFRKNFFPASLLCHGHYKMLVQNSGSRNVGLSGKSVSGQEEMLDKDLLPPGKKLEVADLLPAGALGSFLKGTGLHLMHDPSLLAFCKL